MKLKDKLMLLSLKALPKNELSWFFGKIANIKVPSFVIKKFAKQFNINIDEAEKNITEYKTLNEFFTRKLKNGARIVDNSENIITSPSDGVISQFGNIEDTKLLQIKGKFYNLEKLLKDNNAEKFKNGSFITIYLSPQNYHRVHFCCDGNIEATKYIKGKLFPVNKLSVSNIDELFCINERVITYINNKKAGKIANIMVGATNVGSITLYYDDLKTNQAFQKGKHISYDIDEKNIKKGDMLGCFNFGSTVVMLFEKDKIEFTDIKHNQVVKMGEKIAKIK